MNLDQQKVVMVWENAIFARIGVIGGLIVILFFLFAMIEAPLTKRSFEDYLASELYTIDKNELSEKRDAKKNERETDHSANSAGEDYEGLTKKRGRASRNYHNEIFEEGEHVLNVSKAGLFAMCCGGRKISQIFSKARRFTAQELNITSIVKS